MVPSANRLHVLPLALCASALLMAGLAVAFWTATIDVGEAGRYVAAALGLSAVFELGLGLFFFSRTRS